MLGEIQMSTAKGISIDLKDVSEAAKVIHSCNSELNTIFTDIRRRVSDLTATWECSASNKLSENFSNLYSKFENCRGIIGSYEDHLKKTVESYRQTETKNTTNASAFD